MRACTNPPIRLSVCHLHVHTSRYPPITIVSIHTYTTTHSHSLTLTNAECPQSSLPTSPSQSLQSITIINPSLWWWWWDPVVLFHRFFQIPYANSAFRPLELPRKWAGVPIGKLREAVQNRSGAVPDPSRVLPPAPGALLAVLKPSRAPGGHPNHAGFEGGGNRTAIRDWYVSRRPGTTEPRCLLGTRGSAQRDFGRRARCRRSTLEERDRGQRPLSWEDAFRPAGLASTCPLPVP